MHKNLSQSRQYIKTFSYFTLTAGRGKRKTIKRKKEKTRKKEESFNMMQINVSNSEAKKTEATNAQKRTPYAEHTDSQKVLMESTRVYYHFFLFTV